jgi:hypothetical protein
MEKNLFPIVFWVSEITREPKMYLILFQNGQRVRYHEGIRRFSDSNVHPILKFQAVFFDRIKQEILEKGAASWFKPMLLKYQR